MSGEKTIKEILAKAEEFIRLEKARQAEPDYMDELRARARAELEAERVALSAFTQHLVRRLNDPDERERALEELRLHSREGGSIERTGPQRNTEAPQHPSPQNRSRQNVSYEERDREDAKIFGSEVALLIARMKEDERDLSWLHKRLFDAVRKFHANEALEQAKEAWRIAIGQSLRVEEIFAQVEAELRSLPQTSDSAANSSFKVRRADAARRLIEIVDEVEKDDEYGIALAGVTFLFQHGEASGLVPAPMLSPRGYEAHARILLRRVFSRSRYDAKALAVAILRAWGLELEEARIRLKNMDV